MWIVHQNVKKSVFKIALSEDYKRLVSILIHKAKAWGFTNEESEDIAHDAFCHILDQIKNGKMDKFLEQSDPRSVIKKLLVSKGFNVAASRIFRKKKRQKIYYLSQYRNILPAYDGEIMLDNITDNETRLIAVRQAFKNHLDDIKRSVLELYYFENFSLRKIAKQLSKSVSAIKMIKFRAIQELRVSKEIQQYITTPNLRKKRRAYQHTKKHSHSCGSGRPSCENS